MDWQHIGQAIVAMLTVISLRFHQVQVLYEKLLLLSAIGSTLQAETVTFKNVIHLSEASSAATADQLWRATLNADASLTETQFGPSQNASTLETVWSGEVERGRAHFPVAGQLRVIGPTTYFFISKLPPLGLLEVQQFENRWWRLPVPPVVRTAQGNLESDVLFAFLETAVMDAKLEKVSLDFWKTRGKMVLSWPAWDTAPWDAWCGSVTNLSSELQFNWQSMQLKEYSVQGSCVLKQQWAGLPVGTNMSFKVDGVVQTKQAPLQVELPPASTEWPQTDDWLRIKPAELP